MRSLLTPHVFRRLLRDEPIRHYDCLYRRAIHTRAYRLRIASSAPRQKRTLFGWINPVPQEVLTATSERASLAYLKDACSRIENDVRPPPTDQLVKAWTSFIHERHARKAKLSDVEASYVRTIFELLKNEARAEGKDFGELVPDEALVAAMGCLHSADFIEGERAAQEAFWQLSKTLFDEIEARASSDSAGAIWSEKKDARGTIYEGLWLKHLGILAQCGHVAEARDAILRSTMPSRVVEFAWVGFLRRLAESSTSLPDIESLPALIQRQISPLNAEIRKRLAVLFARKGDMALAKQHAVFQSDDGAPITDARYLETLLNACRTHDALDWARDILKATTSNTSVMKSHKGLWNLVFKWAVTTGKSVDELDRMMKVMVKTNPTFQPSTQDFNALIRIANEKRDPYLAERLITLGERWGNTPDEETYLLQMDYRLSVNDVEGARVAFDYVKSFQEGHGGTSARINRLIQAMCARKSYSFDTIMDVVDFLGERGGRFEAQTVAALATLHLNRDEYTDVADLLTTHLVEFSLAERETVRKAILELMLHPSTPLARLWDTYMIFQHVFEEAPRVDRTAVMRLFFERKRPDMALHVFNHMRRHASPAINPDTETYVAALVGCAHTADDESLTVVNNVLKLDITAVETTRLNNARMLAFLLTGSPSKAQAVWDDIVRSEEGPSRNSLLLVFRVCEHSNFGEVRAKKVWNLLREMDVPLDSEVVAAYVGALAANGCEEEAKTVVDSAEDVLGIAVDDIILAKLFNGAVNSVKQVQTEKWIHERFPQAWARLENMGFRTTPKGTRELPIDVSMEP
ncbi:uncharacterized protein PV09_05746 [Verruconis gallopava]|uniref:Complex I intermediate-associated protein 84, mitochondrial n=1 Tax=Verruconis gallopava TaxID=253628 RepID=A0A0D1XL53_9PEZI|nr:uncharacterized protein PV09_05746 [Verruconis gallopava]KIW03101.1 hypothetical protein PV09_05746 [Verruconis gallopava]